MSLSLRNFGSFDVPDTEELSDVQRNRETMNASPDNCWMETTTNSDEGSGYNSDYDESDSVENCEGQNVNDRTYWKYNMEPSSILNSRGSSSDRSEYFKLTILEVWFQFQKYRKYGFLTLF